MRKFCLWLLLFSCSALCAADVRYEFDAADPGNIVIPAGIERSAGGFRMHNGKEGIVIPGSEKFRFAESWRLTKQKVKILPPSKTAKSS